MKIRIEQDTDPLNPRVDWDNLGQMLCFHGRYKLGDEHDFSTNDYISWESMRDALEKQGAVVVLPLYLYDHGGITISTSPFHCPWDSGQIGFIVAWRDHVLKEYGHKRNVTAKLRERVTKVLEAEVKVYDQYLTGDVYGYVIEDDDGEELDSCWGFFGREYCEEEAQSVLEHLQK